MKVAVAGYGMEGRASIKYWLSRGDDVTVLDEASDVGELPKGVSCVLGPKAFVNVDSFDVVVRTASLRPDKLKASQKIWSATNEFFAECPAPIIGVTGTKGKGTTSSLIASILQVVGKKVHLLGNIGTPALEILPDIKASDVVVFELSSFQLWDLQKSPHVAVVLMIEPDHQDVHASIEEYVAAKSNIRRNQVVGDVCFYHPTNQLSRQIAYSASVSKPYRYGVADDGGCYVRDNKFFVHDVEICATDSLRLVGAHNIENACAAISAAWEFTRNTEAIEDGLRSFEGLPHRIKFIREVDGVKYYDDNYSSAPGAAIAAMKSFVEPEVLILGGYDKKVDFAELAREFSLQSNIKKIILIGQTRHKIAAAFDAVDKTDIYELSDSKKLEPIVQRAKNLAEPGDVVVMSPACASFDMFKNFGERGDQFIAMVEKI